MLKAGVTVLGLCLSAPLLGQPCVQEREVRPLEVILDLRNGLALVPEGTVIPKDYRISVAAYMLPETTDRSPRAAEERARQALSSGRSTPLKPLVFAYANQSAFDPHRERSKAFAERVRTLSGYCDGPEITYGVPDDPNCEGCTFTLLTTYCIADGPNPELYELTAIAEIASSGSPGYAAASVTSSDAYLNCYSGSPYSSYETCTSSDTRTISGIASWGTDGYAEFYQDQDNTTYVVQASVCCRPMGDHHGIGGARTQPKQ